MLPPTFHMPDGTKTTNRPKDGQVWNKWDSQGNPIETWQWDDFLGQWFNVSSGKPTPHNTKTFVINCPMDLDNVELEEVIFGGSWSHFKCECGSEKCGSSGHSSWCPKYKP